MFRSSRFYAGLTVASLQQASAMQVPPFQNRAYALQKRAYDFQKRAYAMGWQKRVRIFLMRIFALGRMGAKGHPKYQNLTRERFWCQCAASLTEEE